MPGHWCRPLHALSRGSQAPALPPRRGGAHTAPALHLYALQLVAGQVAEREVRHDLHELLLREELELRECADVGEAWQGWLAQLGMALPTQRAPPNVNRAAHLLWRERQVFPLKGRCRHVFEERGVGHGGPALPAPLLQSCAVRGCGAGGQRGGAAGAWRHCC